MFDFDKPEDGSEARYHERVRNWQAGTPTILSTTEGEVRGRDIAVDDPPVPRRLSAAQHHVWWLIHNVVAHPMIVIAPMGLTFRFHDWTSRKLNGL
jgi:hypothetical protein